MTFRLKFSKSSANKFESFLLQNPHESHIKRMNKEIIVVVSIAHASMHLSCQEGDLIKKTQKPSWRGLRGGGQIRFVGDIEHRRFFLEMSL